MYKKAAQLKLRFSTNVGVLSVEQLMDLSMAQLKSEIKKAFTVKKKLEGQEDEAELAFLEESCSDNKELELASLKYEILKDIFNTKKTEIEERRVDVSKKEEIKRLEEILASKKADAEKNLSVEELEKRIKELKEAK